MRGLPLLYIFIYDLKKGVTKYWKIEKKNEPKKGQLLQKAL